MLIKSLLRRRLGTKTDTSSRQLSVRQSRDLAIIGGRGYHSSYGGVENAIREISSQLVSAKALNVIVYGTDSSEAIDHDNRGNAKSELAHKHAPHIVYRVFGQHGAVLACVLHAVLISRPKTVLLFASGPCVFVPIIRLFGIPVVSSLRAIDSQRDKWGVVSRTILKLGEYFAWRFSSVFTVNSAEMVRAFKTKRADVVFIPNGSRATDHCNTSVLNELGLADKGYFLFAARLDPVKRLHLLLRAHAQLEPQGRLPLVVAGGHSKSMSYQQELHSLAAPDVLFLGHISAAQLDPLMRHCRAFLLPSVLEGMSNSLLSAMAAGCAVLASDIPPNANVLDNPDAVFPADDIAALKRGMDRLSSDHRFVEALGTSLKAHASENYSWEKTADLFYAQLKPYLKKVISDA